MDSISWYIYVLLCNGGYFYIGITLNIDKRLHQHNTQTGANFTKKHKPIRCIYTECLNTLNKKEASKIETLYTRFYRSIYGADNVVGGKLLQLKSPTN
jgi:putative endonuclease